MNEQQKNRRQRGEDFQNEIRRSWRLVPNSWRRRVVDGEGSGTQPADEIILLPDGNILAEHKRTVNDTFSINKLEPNQQKGLLDFDAVLPHNYGLVFISFLDEPRGVDCTYVVRFLTLARLLRSRNRLSITRQELAAPLSIAYSVPFMPGEERIYDLRGLSSCLVFL